MTVLSSPFADEHDATIASIEDFLAEVIPLLLPVEYGVRGRGRPRVLPALCLWSGLLVCVLRGFSSQLALWRLLTIGGLWHFPRIAITDEAVYRRLARDGLDPLLHLCAAISALLADRLAPYADETLAPFATEVLVLDETTLDKVARHLPTLRDAQDAAHPPLGGKLAGIFDLRRQQWQHLAYFEDTTENEKLHARDLLLQVPAGSLLLMDLGYYAYDWFDDLTDGAYYWISRQRTNGSQRVIHTYYHQGDTFDGIIELGTHRANRATYAVRLVQFRMGGVLYRYLTNVLDPHRLTPAAIARMYARRWDIELAIKTVKRHLGLHLLWSAKPIVIQQQVVATVIIAQILQAMRLELAGRAGVDPFEISLPLLITYLPQFAARGLDPYAAFLEYGREVRFIRPSTRTVIDAPEIPRQEITPMPPDLCLTRSPHHAHKGAGRQVLPPTTRN
jgi:hypothetical protein